MTRKHERVTRKKRKGGGSVGAARKVSPNWSQETMTCHSHNCFRIVWGLGNAPLVTPSEQLLHTRAEAVAPFLSPEEFFFFFFVFPFLNFGDTAILETEIC